MIWCHWGIDGEIQAGKMVGSMWCQSFFFPTYTGTGRTPALLCSAHRWGFNQEKGKITRTKGDKSKLIWRVYPTPPGWRERKDVRKGNPEGGQQTTNFWVPCSLKEFPTFTFTFCFPNKNPFIFCSPINCDKLSPFSCLLILYPVEKKNPYHLGYGHLSWTLRDLQGQYLLDWTGWDTHREQPLSFWRLPGSISSGSPHSQD
jgi:hypothetical protein